MRKGLQKKGDQSNLGWIALGTNLGWIALGPKDLCIIDTEIQWILVGNHQAFTGLGLASQRRGLGHQKSFIFHHVALELSFFIFQKHILSAGQRGVMQGLRFFDFAVSREGT